jgi:hypothetical protein
MLISQQEQYSWENDLFLIGIPPLERIVVFDPMSKKFPGKSIDPSGWSTNQFDVECYDSLKSLQHHGDRLLTIHESRNLTELQTLQKLFLIAQWLDSKCARYVIINLSVPFMKNNLWRPAVFLDKYFAQHSKTILSDNTYYTINLHVNKPVDYDRYKWMGHHGPAGNKHFFENSLLPTMQRNNFC